MGLSVVTVTAAGPPPPCHDHGLSTRQRDTSMARLAIMQGSGLEHRHSRPGTQLVHGVSLQLSR